MDDNTQTPTITPPAPAAPEAGQAQTADAAIPMWVVALIGRQQLELELLRDQVQRAQQSGGGAAGA